jgi:phage terminase small subunit
MPKARSPGRDQAYEIYKEHGGEIENRRIAEQLGISEKTVGGWKCKDKWDLKINGVLQTNERSTPKTKGGQPGNKNATGPPENKNAEKHGFFSKWLPEETAEIMKAIEKADPLDILWDNIQLQYAAIIRAQRLMYVKDQEDITTTKIGEGYSDAGGSEKWEVQQAWDKHATFLNAQSRAMKTLEGMIKQYDELLHKNWDLATEEQKARITVLKDKVNSEKDIPIQITFTKASDKHGN